MVQKIRDHRWMRVWQNADKLDCLVQKILKRIPRSEVALRQQIDSAADSVGANFVEGYYSGSVPEYIRFNRYSKRSLGELRERVRRTVRKGYVTEAEYEEFEDLAIKTMYLFDRLIVALKEKSIAHASASSRPSRSSQAFLSPLKPSR